MGTDTETLHCWTDGVTTISAYSAADAADLLREEYAEEPARADGFALVPDDEVIRMRSDEPGAPEFVEKTAGEWAAEGRGPVCSTEW